MTKEDIKIYKNIIKEIGEKCKEYFEQHKPFPIAKFLKWEFSGVDHIRIHYSFNEYYYSANIIPTYDSWEIPINYLLDEE